MAAVSIACVDCIAAVDPDAWDRLAGDDNPFVAHGFLAALEDSGSVGRGTGWMPRHLVARDGAGAVVGVAPAYLKAHSYGEYVFDHGWAQAYEQAGGRYYPKLQVAVPFTPVPGPRLLAPDPTVRVALAGALIELARGSGLSSVHATFCAETDLAAFDEAGYLTRHGFQYHWRNRGYADFEAFLESLTSRKRKAIRRERRAVADQGLTMRTLSGPDLTPEVWDFFFRCYRATTDRKWGEPYLTRKFFDRLGAAMPDRIALMVAEKDGRLVAGALNLVGGDCLYGRNWGALDAFPFLHFELCYHRAIEHAIIQGLARVEAGAQGDHKLQRGYLPALTTSVHWIADPGLRGPVAAFLARERAHVARLIAGLAEEGPFRDALAAGDDVTA
jgi:predicted N-acyltransferase